MRRFLAILLCLVLSPVASAQTHVAMKIAARVKAGEAIRVRDVASVSGDNAETVGDLVLIADPAGATPGSATWMEIQPRLVKNAAEKAGIAPTTIVLSGPVCAVRFIGLGGLSGLGDTPKSATSEQPAQVVQDLPTNGLVRGVVLARLAQMLQAETDELRVSFDARDRELLDKQTAGYRVLAVPTAAALSQRIPFRVTLFEGDKLVEERTISTDVLVKTQAVVMLSNVERGTEITPAMIEERTEWLAPSSKPPAQHEQTIGSAAKTRLEAGKILCAGDVEAPIAAKRGEIVYVDCLSGKLVVKVRARAVATARSGEVVELKIDDSDGTFFARMNGKGRAVMLVGNRGAQ